MPGGGRRARKESGDHDRGTCSAASIGERRMDVERRRRRRARVGAMNETQMATTPGSSGGGARNIPDMQSTPKRTGYERNTRRHGWSAPTGAVLAVVACVSIAARSFAFSG